MILLVTALVFLIFISGSLSASETAMFSLTSMKVRAFKTSENKMEKLIADLLSRPRKLLVTILMMNVLVNILVQNVVSAIFGTLSGWFFTVGLPLILVLIFGEVVPKTIALARNEWISKHVSSFIYGAERFLKPVRDAIVWITTPISKGMFFFLRKEKEISTNELKHALRTSKEFGVLNQDEANLVRGYLNLEELTVKEVMCPRQEILYYDLNQPLSKLISLFVDQECTRIPICHGSLEETLGVLSSKDFFLHRHQIQSANDIESFLVKVHFVPEMMQTKDCMRLFYDRQEQMMLVVDEYGSVCGLITLEDIIEVVVGQIEDRRDLSERFTRSGEDVIISSGKLELNELEEVFDVRLESPNNMVTVGGWLTEKLGDIPKSGSKYQTDDFLFHVLSSDPNRIRRVYIRKLKNPKKGKKAYE